jgi:starch-binding outer membrane protein, SusD/RagB family
MNWAWGSMRSDDAYKGSEPSDQNQLNPIERFEVLPSNSSVRDKWTGSYDGIGQVNVTLRLLADVALPEAQKRSIEAQARFIRGIHHMEAVIHYNRVPFVDETVVDLPQFAQLTNTADIWPRIEADLKFAYDNLPETQAQLGRVNKWAAGAYLAKAQMFQRKWAEARTLLQTVIQQGKTPSGAAYALMPRYGDVFRGVNENGPEVVLSIQYTVGDGNAGASGNQDAVLANPHNNGPGGCCGFFQPSQNLVNAYKTSANGLPLFDTFNNSDVNNFESTPNNLLYDGPLDPRLDWSVGRIGIPYLDWGVASTSWIRLSSNGGPYLPKKHIHYRDELGTFQTAGGWGQSILGKNWLMMRFADLLLLKAECDVETNNLEEARALVNRVRRRAANPDGFVKTATGANAANYVISEYTAPWTDQAVARTAVLFERRLELAMEGHRWYDLLRRGNDVLINTMTEYLRVEAPKRTHLAGARIARNKDEYLPIPLDQILRSTINGTSNIQQNPGY